VKAIGVHQWLRATFTALFALAACTKPVDKAAKERIFSPEDPPKVIASALEKLPVEHLEDSPKQVRRILEMGAAETTERIGPFQLKSFFKFEWSGNSRSIKLTETRTMISGPGGVNGDFHATVENSENQGLDVMRVAGGVYARSRYGRYRQRLRDRGIAERERDEIFSALRVFDSFFQGRLKLSSPAPVSVHGRPARKYQVGLAAGEGPEVESNPLPRLPLPKGGMDPSSARHNLFWEKRSPKSVRGEVVIDDQSAVVLQARLDGKLAVAGSQGGPKAELSISLDSAMTEIGVNPGLKPPKDFLPDADKPAGIAAALDRFGIRHGNIRSADGGTEDEPSDTER
jgi:hypothetical protein